MESQRASIAKPEVDITPRVWIVAEGRAGNTHKVKMSRFYECTDGKPSSSADSRFLLIHENLDDANDFEHGVPAKID